MWKCFGVGEKEGGIDKCQIKPVELIFGQWAYRLSCSFGPNLLGLLVHIKHGYAYAVQLSYNTTLRRGVVTKYKKAAHLNLWSYDTSLVIKFKWPDCTDNDGAGNRACGEWDFFQHMARIILGNNNLID